MNIHPKRVHVQKGSYTRPSVTIVLVGQSEVSTAWALNLLSVRVPLNSDFRVETAVSEAVAYARYVAQKQHSTYTFIWPEGIYLKWDAICNAVSTYPSGIFSCDLLEQVDPANSGHPNVSLDLSVNPALTIVLGIPSLGTTSLTWAKYLMELSMPIGTVWYLAYIEGFEIGEARQKIVDQVLALRPIPAFLLFLGDDNLPPPNGAKQLYDDLQAYPDIMAVGGIYHTKTQPKQVCAWNNNRTLREGVDYESNSLIEVESMGLDFCMIRTEYLSKLSSPMFQTIQNATRHATEDSFFWAKCKKELGRRPFLNTGIQVGHYNVQDNKIY